MLFRLVIFMILIAGAARADAPRVVADIPATQSLVAMVMAGVAEPDLLVGAGGDPHSFQLRPSQARALARADAVFWIGPDLTPWLARVLEGSGASAVAMQLAEAPGMTERAPMFGADHDDEDGDAHGDHDPHVWLDPENAAAMVSAIAEHLSAIDPGNAATYAANARTTRNALIGLTATVTAKLTPFRDARLVVFHDGYAHFAGRFGLTITGSLALGDAATPGAAGLANLRQSIMAGGADCIFAEPQHSRAMIEALTEGTDLRIGQLDPSGTMLPPGADLYDDLIRGLAQGVADCLTSP